MATDPHCLRHAATGCRLVAVSAVLLLLGACAFRPYQGTQLDQASFLDRAIRQQVGDIEVSAAVPDAAETLALTGLDLYAQGIQPVWLRVRNKGDAIARTSLWSIDRDYYSPIEVAYMNRGGYSDSGYEALQRWFHDNGLRRFTAPGGQTEGLVFTHLRPGTKGFNLSVFAGGKSHEYTFFVPLPGFTPDFMTVDFDRLYSAEETGDLETLAAARDMLENELGCCASDPSGDLEAGPLNAVLVGSGKAVRRAMLRGGWLENEADSDSQQRAYNQHYRGRPPDAIFTRLRQDGNERIQIHIWMAPWRYRGEPVWACTVFYFTQEHTVLGALTDRKSFADSKLISLFVRESVSADIDSAQRYLLQNLWFNGSLRKVGFVRGMPPVSVDEPRVSLGEVAYFTNGLRLVAQLSEAPLAMDQTEFVFDPLWHRQPREDLP